MSDARFTQRAVGVLGEVTFEITLSDTGAIAEVTFVPESDPLLQGLVERAIRFLGRGQFALQESEAGDLSGVQRVTLEVALRQGEPDEDTDDPLATRSLGFEPPKLTASGERRGFGYFELRGGLRVEFTTRFLKD